MTDQDVRDFLERMAAEEPVPFLDAAPLTRRGRRRAARTVVVGAVAIAAAIAVVLGGVGAIRSTPVPVDDPTPTPAPSEDLGIFAPFAGRIVYGNKHGVWAVDPTAPADPVATLQLTSEAADPLGWSSDGTRLLLERGQYLFVLHADGSETQVTTDPMNIEGATISPDGSRVVFAGKPKDDAAPYALYAVDADGGPAEMLVESRMGVVRTPTFSPDGTQIAYVDDNIDVDHGVWLMNADGSDAHQIVPEPGVGHVSGLAWSPAGDRIVLAWAPGEDPGVYTFAPDGSDFTQVVTTDAQSPSWSPDGSQLAYTVDCLDPDGCGFAIADADGSNVQTFHFGAPGPWHPAPITSNEPPLAGDSAASSARRDGEFLVFARMGTGTGLDIATQDPQTGEVRKIVETDGIVDCPEPSRCASFVGRAEWSSDGHWVAFQVSSAPDGPCTPSDGVWVQGPVGDPWQLTTPCQATPGAKGIEELWAWSPDGARLAYARVDGDIGDKLFVIDPTDGSRTFLLSGGGDRTALEWTPDGDWIAVASEGDGIIEVTAEPGSNPGLWELEDSFENVRDIDHSPDGTQIMVQDQGGNRVQVLNADGSGLHLLLEGEGACCAATWSPNGDRILYQLSTENGASSSDSEVWTVAPDGSDAIKVFESNGCDMSATGDALPVWAPNGTQVAYNACGTWVVANADGTGESQPIDELIYRSWAGGGLSG